MIYYCDACGKEMRIKKSLYQRLLDGKQKHITCSKQCSYNLKHTGHEVTCENCGKKFYRRQYHIDMHEHMYCCQQCQIEHRHKEKFEIRKCEICGTEFECSKLSTQRFCSQLCNSKWQTQFVGELNPQFTRVKMKCDYCGNDIYVKQSRLESQEHHFCNEKCRQKWFAEVWSQREEWKDMCRERIIDELTSGKMNTINSQPQQIVDELLRKLHINFEKEKNIKYYAVDNYLLDYNLMIEVQGDYWHSSPIQFATKLNQQQFDRISKDKAKHTYIYNHYNIEPLYLWESDINNRLDVCEKLILEYIQKNGILDNYHSFNYDINKENKIILNNNIVIPYQDMDIEQYRSLLIKAS